MKTATNINQDFGATRICTKGSVKENCYTCEVELPDGQIITGFGSTIEKAEDTAWYGVKITLEP